LPTPFGTLSYIAPPVEGWFPASFGGGSKVIEVTRNRKETAFLTTRERYTSNVVSLTQIPYSLRRSKQVVRLAGAIKPQALKMILNKNIAVAILATSIGTFAAATASAVNPDYTPNTQQVILGFQGINGFGGTDVVQVVLGSANIYRDATANIPNIVNIGSLLTSWTGSSTWYESTNLFWGLGTVWSNGNPPADLYNGDPDQTVYISKARTAVGSELIKNSTITTPTGSQLGSASNALISMGGRIYNDGTSGAQTYAKSLTNTWEDYNVTSNAGVQSTAFGFVAGGTQFRFGAGSFGTFSTGAAEGALDFYRAQRVNDIAGQFDEGGIVNVPQYEGIFTINQAGDVSFIAPVPEPSSALLVGASVLGMAFRRRRTIAA
jgi:hypothetical protein